MHVIKFIISLLCVFLCMYSNHNFMNRINAFVIGNNILIRCFVLQIKHYSYAISPIVRLASCCSGKKFISWDINSILKERSSSRWYKPNVITYYVLRRNVKYVLSYLSYLGYRVKFRDIFSTWICKIIISHCYFLCTFSILFKWSREKCPAHSTIKCFFFQ